MNACAVGASLFAASPTSTPTRRVCCVCCARTASGHAATPPITPRTSRLFMGHPNRQLKFAAMKRSEHSMRVHPAPGFASRGPARSEPANNQFWVAFNKHWHALDLQVAQGRKREVPMLPGLGHTARRRPATTTSPSTSSMRIPQLQFRAIEFVEQLQCAFRVATRRTRFKALPRVEVGQRDGG